MTGFLAGLAARSIGQAPLLEPRRLPYESREEPPTDVVVTPTVDAEHEPVPELDAERPPGASPAPLVASEPIPPAHEREVLGDQDPAVVPAVPPSRAQRAVRPRSRVPAEPPSGATRDSSPGVRKPRDARTARQPNRDARDALRAVGVAPRQADSNERTPAPRRSALASRRTPAEDRPAGKQVVKITIGRVDVRAVAAPLDGTAPARPAPPPRMTLVDYLARGRRR